LTEKEKMLDGVAYDPMDPLSLPPRFSGVSGGYRALRRNEPMRGISFVLMLMALIATGCGDDGDDEKKTPYGSAEEVWAYRARIDAVIDEVNAVQNEVERTAVGSAGRATGENLAAAYSRLKPRMLAVLEELEEIDPPAALAELHGDIRELILLRLAAYDQVIEGWEVERENSFAEAEPLYDEAEDKLEEASLLAAGINEELEQVDVALAEVGGYGPVA